MPYRFSVAQKCTFLKSSCSIFSKPSSWSTLEARVGGDSLLLEVGNKNKYSQILLSSHNSLVCTKLVCVSVLSGMPWIHKTKKKYLTVHGTCAVYYQGEQTQPMIKCCHSITQFISTSAHYIRLELPQLWTTSHAHLRQEGTCTKVQLYLEFFCFHFPTSWELVKSSTKARNSFQTKVFELFPSVCNWGWVFMWYTCLPCIRLYLCSKLVLSLITTGGSAHRPVVFIRNSKEWSSLNWKDRCREQQWHQ